MRATLQSIYLVCVAVFNIARFSNCQNFENNSSNGIVSTLSHILSVDVFRWVTVDERNAGEAIMQRPDPIGIESGNKMYLCRADIDNKYLPGSLWLYAGKMFCRISDGAEIRRETFQMLEYPPGAISWLPANGVLPNAIVGGKHSDQTNAYICRGMHNGALIAGKYDGSSCYAAIGLIEVIIVENIELLVINPYGMLLAT